MTSLLARESRDPVTMVNIPSGVTWLKGQSVYLGTSLREAGGDIPSAELGVFLNKLLKSISMS